jgi:hypothetical protein
MAQDRQPDGAYGPIHGPVRQAHLLGHLPDGNLQLKELDERQPLHTAQSSLVDPSSGEVMKRILATGTTVPLIGQFVKFSAVATRAKPLMVFKAFSQQVFSGFTLAAD